MMKKLLLAITCARAQARTAINFSINPVTVMPATMMNGYAYEDILWTSLLIIS